jgi:aspartate aminotransferase-like enzyme
VTPGGESLAAPLLMTPGPTRVPERVLRAGSRPMIHHRTPEFAAELGAMLEMLGPVFGTTSRVLPVHTTGRGALEAGICNLFSPDDEIAVCCNGRFGEMWAGFAESYGLVVHRVGRDWMHDIDPREMERALLEHPRIRGVALAYCDTSTGVRNDVEGVARMAAASGALVLVDGVSALGGMPFSFDAWGVDFACTASQKCLMSSPGLSFVALSDRARATAAQAQLPRNYWDFRQIDRDVAKPRPGTPGTPPVHVVLQVAEALRMIHEEGLEQVFARHETMATLVRQRLPVLHLEQQCSALRQYSPTLTAIGVPDGIAAKSLRDALRARGILTAAGLGQFGERAFRIGHMGDIRVEDVARTLDALAEVLHIVKSDDGPSANTPAATISEGR